MSTAWLPPEQEQDRPLPRHRPNYGTGEGRGHLHQRREAAGGGEVDRYRHRLRGPGPPGLRHRREARRLLDRRAVPGRGAEAPCWSSGAAISASSSARSGPKLGTEVTVVEYSTAWPRAVTLNSLRQLQRSLAKQRLAFKLGTKVVGVDSEGKTLKLTLEPAKGGDAESARWRYGAGRRRPHALHPRPRPRRGRACKPDNRGRIVVDDDILDQRARHLRHRRRDQRPDACPQGRGGRRARSPRSWPAKRGM